MKYKFYVCEQKQDQTEQNIHIIRWSERKHANRCGLECWLSMVYIYSKLLKCRYKFYVYYANKCGLSAIRNEEKNTSNATPTVPSIQFKGISFTFPSLLEYTWKCYAIRYLSTQTAPKTKSFYRTNEIIIHSYSSKNVGCYGKLSRFTLFRRFHFVTFNWDCYFNCWYQFRLQRFENNLSTLTGKC